MMALREAAYQCGTCGESLTRVPVDSLTNVYTMQRALLRHGGGGIIDRTAQGWTPCPHRNKLFLAPVEFVELQPVEGVPHVEPDSNYPV